MMFGVALVFMYLCLCAKSIRSRLVLVFAVRCLRYVDADLPSP